MTIRVLLADDHEMLRENVREFLAGQDGMEVVGEAVDGESALEQARRLQPDVVVMDISMPGVGGGGCRHPADPRRTARGAGSGPVPSQRKGLRPGDARCGVLRGTS